MSLSRSDRMFGAMREAWPDWVSSEVASGFGTRNTVRPSPDALLAVGSLALAMSVLEGTGIMATGQEGPPKGQQKTLGACV